MFPTYLGRAEGRERGRWSDCESVLAIVGQAKGSIVAGSLETTQSASSCAIKLDTATIRCRLSSSVAMYDLRIPPKTPTYHMFSAGSIGGPLKCPFYHAPKHTHVREYHRRNSRHWKAATAYLLDPPCIFRASSKPLKLLEG